MTTRRGRDTKQFLDITVKVCPKLNEEISRMIGEEVWKTSKDVRDVVSLSKLIRKSDGSDEIEAIMRTFYQIQYSNMIFSYVIPILEP